MSETPPTYPPLPPAEPLLSERVADLEAQIRESGDVAAVAELKSKLAQAVSDRDKALEENANACEILSHHVEPPCTDLPGMVLALLKQRLPDLRGYLKAVLGFAPEEVIVTGPAPGRLNLPPEISGFQVGEAERRRERDTAATARVQLLAKGFTPPHKRGSEPWMNDFTPPHKRGSEPWMNEGFTPPHSPAKVSPATFGPRVSSEKILGADVLPGLEFERLPNGSWRVAAPAVTVKQLGGPPLSYATDGSSGLDLPVSESAQLGAGAGRRFRTGIKVEIPPGYEGQIRPRSSCPSTLEVRFGTIDSDCRGEIQVVILSRRAPHDTDYDVISPDKPIAQLVIAPVAKAKIEQVDALTPTARGEGGFGSTNAPATPEQLDRLHRPTVTQRIALDPTFAVHAPWHLDGLGPTDRAAWQRWLDAAPEVDRAKAEEVRAAFGHVNRVEVTLYGEGTLKGPIPAVSVASEKHPIQAAAERVTATTEALLTARAEAAEATRAYRAAIDEQEDKSKGLAAATRAVNEWSANNRLNFAKAVEIGDAALAAIGLTSYRCKVTGDPPRLSLIPAPFLGPDLERTEDISGE